MNEEKVFGGLRDNASFCSHHLVFSAKKITIKPTLTLLILYSIFLVGGAGFLVGVLSVDTDDRRAVIIGSCFSIVFMLVGGGLIAFELLRKLPEIDLRKRMFYPKGNSSDGIPLEELREMRTGSFDAHGKNSVYTVYTFDLVFRNGDEYRLISHGSYEVFKEESEKVIKLLSAPGAENSDLPGEELPVKRKEVSGSGGKRNAWFSMIFGIAWSWVVLQMFFSVEMQIIKAGISAAKWHPVTATVESGRVVPEGSEHFVAEVAYNYRFNGKEYHSSRTDLIQINYNSTGDAEKALKKYPAKSQVQCYVNPDDPAEAVLDRSLPLPFYVMFLPTTLLFLVIGIVIFLSGAKDVYKNYRRRFL